LSSVLVPPAEMALLCRVVYPASRLPRGLLGSWYCGCLILFIVSFIFNCCFTYRKPIRQRFFQLDLQHQPRRVQQNFHIFEAWHAVVQARRTLIAMLSKTGPGLGRLSRVKLVSDQSVKPYSFSDSRRILFARAGVSPLGWAWAKKIAEFLPKTGTVEAERRIQPPGFATWYRHHLHHWIRHRERCPWPQCPVCFEQEQWCARLEELEKFTLSKGSQKFMERNRLRNRLSRLPAHVKAVQTQFPDFKADCLSLVTTPRKVVVGGGDLIIIYYICIYKYIYIIYKYACVCRVWL
jgi:hypothetical protein